MTDNLANASLVNALSTEEVSAIEAEVLHLPNRQAAAIDALKIVQGYRGWISDDSLAAIAKILHMSTEELDGIATFYNLIYRRPVGEKVILMCDSVSCFLMGGEKVCAHLKNLLNIEFGETSSDGKYTLLPVTCLGDCDHAPAMMVGDQLYHDLSVDGLDELFKDDQSESVDG